MGKRGRVATTVLDARQPPIAVEEIHELRARIAEDEHPSRLDQAEGNVSPFDEIPGPAALLKAQYAATLENDLGAGAVDGESQVIVVLPVRTERALDRPILEHRAIVVALKIDGQPPAKEQVS